MKISDQPSVANDVANAEPRAGSGAEQSIEVLTQQLDRARRELQANNWRNRVLFDDSPLPLIVFSSIDLCVLDVNAACLSTFGYVREQWIGQFVGFAVAIQQRAEVSTLAQRAMTESATASHIGRLRILHHDGYVLDTEGVMQRFDDTDRPPLILIVQDATERRQSEEHLRLLVKEHRQQLELTEKYDTLTGLPNRSLFGERLRQGIIQSQLSASLMAVCYLDLDDFGSLNDAHGQEVCDHLVINTAECLRSCLRGGDTLIRIGSDEFVMLVLGLKSDDEVGRFIHQLQTRLSEPFVSDTAIVTVSASIGVTLYPQDNSDSESLLRHALQAMILAKQGGKAGARRFDPESDRRVRAKRESIENIRAALNRREFVLYYQPKVDLRHGTVIGAEALIRWRHPERGLLPPGAFLPEIEDDEVMSDIGNWVIGEALSQMSRWRENGLDLAVSVNISAQHLMRPDFVDDLTQQLDRQVGSLGRRLEIEVLESSELEDIVRVENIIVACRVLGVEFSLDDFGTGYSSLTYLRRLSAETLKIDQSFVKNMLDDAADCAIVSGVIGLAAAFQRKVIAEGVETIAHAQALLGLGCNMAQGYGIARPMPAEAVSEWIKIWPSRDWMGLCESARCG